VVVVVVFLFWFKQQSTIQNFCRNRAQTVQ
jgi:hypothetical protein